MPAAGSTPSARRTELLERAYAYVLRHGLADLSLRPLATAIGSSPRVLLFLFGSKDGLVRALLARARVDELALLDELRPGDGQPAAGLDVVAARVWEWLAAPQHRPLLMLWAEGYVRSLVDPAGPWAGFARATVDDWLDLLATATARPARHPRRAGRAQPRARGPARRAAVGTGAPLRNGVQAARGKPSRTVWAACLRPAGRAVRT